MDQNDLQEQMQNAQALGQKLEDLVVNAGKITIKTEASPFLIGLWSLVCDYDMVTSLVTKHFGFEKEWAEAQRLYGEWGAQKPGGIEPPERV